MHMLAYIGVAIPGYVLVIMSGASSVDDWDRCGNYNSGQCLHCVIELDNVSVVYDIRLSV